MPAGISRGICESAVSSLAFENDGVASASPRHFSFLTLRPHMLTHTHTHTRVHPSPYGYGLLSHLISIFEFGERLI